MNTYNAVGDGINTGAGLKRPGPVPDSSGRVPISADNVRVREWKGLVQMVLSVLINTTTNDGLRIINAKMAVSVKC